MKRHMACIIGLAFMVSNTNASQYDSMQYHVFIEALRDDIVSSVMFSTDGIIASLRDDGQRTTFIVQDTHRPFHRDPLLLEELTRAGITPGYERSNRPSASDFFLAIIPPLVWTMIPALALIVSLRIHKKVFVLDKRLYDLCRREKS